MLDSMRGWPLILAALAACDPRPPPKELSPETEALFRTLETGTALEALEAAGDLAQVYDDSMLPRLEGVLRGDARARARGLQLIGDLKTEGSAKLLLEQLPDLLDAEAKDVPRMALSAAGLRRLRAATHPILDRLDRLDDKAVLRALGRIWERALDDAPLPRRAEIDRLSVFALVHRLAMTAASSEEACGAMLRVMTRDELDEFLEKHAAERFYARRFCDAAVRRRGFDPAKGARVHQALLRSPDAKLVASILASSPHPLPEEEVRRLLDDRRTMVRDAAAARLARSLKR